MAALSTAGSVVCYDEPSASWVAPTESTLSPMRGYISVSTNSTGTISYTGTLNTGTLTPITLTRQGATKTGFNLVGNPYPSYLDWSLASAANPGVMTTMWYRTKTVTDAYTFDTYNAAGGTYTTNGANTVSNLIPPMQAFWVRVKRRFDNYKHVIYECYAFARRCNNK